MAKKLHMMAGSQLPPACVSNVLDDDDLLTEIIVRVGFPSILVRAAGVCRRWIRLVSDRAFLCRFRKLHPPKLLGFYLAPLKPPARFFSMTLPSDSELAAIVSRTSFLLGTYEGAPIDTVACWNGRVVVSSIVTSSRGERRTAFVVHSPLCSDDSERGMSSVLPSLHFPFQVGNFCWYRQLFCKEEEEGHVQSYFYMMVERTLDPTKSWVHVYMLREGDDAWRAHLTLAADYFVHALSEPNSVLIDNKIYMASALDEILVLDLASSSFSVIQLPQGVDFKTRGAAMLARAADDATGGVYLIHAKKLRLHIWLHKGPGNWLLEDNICLRETCANLPDHDPTAPVEINQHVGVYTEFVFLKMGRCAFYLDVKQRTLRKVYDMSKQDRYFGRIYPYMMIWPPIFPAALKYGPARSSGSA